jgi:flagellar biosynthesis regulator FlbT
MTGTPLQNNLEEYYWYVVMMIMNDEGREEEGRAQSEKMFKQILYCTIV